MMKKFTLFLMTMVLSMVSALSSFAQEPAAPKFSPVATDGQTVQYLYNVDAHAFVLGANDWNTRASVSVEKGYQFKVAANGNGTYTLNDYVENQNAWKAVFAGNPTDIWVDNLNGANVKGWVITEAGENIYKITNPGAGAGELAVVQDLSDTRLNLRGSNPGAYAATWAFVSADDYAEYMSSVDVAAVKAWAAAKKDQVAEALKEEIKAANMVALNAQLALMDGTNVYDAAGFAAYKSAYETTLAAVEAGTYTETVVNPSATTDWHASTAYNFLLTPWTIGGEKANNFDKALYINTWSVEGTNDGTNFLVPFFEYWTGDANSLSANVLSTTVGDLEPGKLYDVTVWARVRIKNGATNPTGITFQAGNGEAVNVCAAPQVGASQFYLAEITASGEADENGNLVIAFNVAADNNISWLSYKNVNYAEAADAMEVETSLVLGEEEVAINDHSEVTVDAADAIKVNVMNAPTAVGFSYVINAMKEVSDEEGTTWVADESADLAVGEGSLNTIGFAQFDDVVYFEQGSKYQVKVTVYGGNPAEPTEIGFYTYVVNGSHAIEPEIAASLVSGEDEIALNSHSAVSVETADGVAVSFDGVIPTSASYKVNSLIEVLGEESSTWEVNETIAEGELSLSGKGYAEFEEQVTFEQGTKYQVEISYVEAPESDPVVVTYNVDGAYVAPVIAAVSLSYNKVEADLNSHSEVSIETADELVVRFGKPVDVIGAMYAINEMVMGSDDEGTFWNPGAEVAVGEMSINTIGNVQFETPINFVHGKKYQVSVTAFGGTMDDPIELGTATYVFNGAYTEPEPVIAYGTNLDFTEGAACTSNVRTYVKDVTGSDVAQLQEIEGWTIVENGDARAAAVFAYGSENFLGGAGYPAPAAGPDGEAGQALGIEAVWSANSQYVQNVTLPKGNYVITMPTYNSVGGTQAIAKNLFGFIAEDGTEYLASEKTWAANKWTNMVVSFTLTEETAGKLSLGYTAANTGNANMPHLFVDNVNIEYVSELDLAKAAAFAKVPAASESIFGYDEETVTGWTLAISNATTVEEVEEVVASIESTPVQAELNTYTIYNVTAENYLGEAVLSADPVEVTFEKANGGYYIKMGDNYVNMLGTNNWSMAVGPEPTTAWSFNLADGVYTISGPKGMIGADNTEAGSATYGDKNAAKNGTWVIEAVPSTEIAVYPALVAGEEEIALNAHSAVSAETADAISVAFENVVPATASYKLSSMVLVAGEESSSWELNETIAEGELSINGKAYVEFEEPVLFEQGTKYQLDITYAPMEGEAATVSYTIDGAYAAPLIAAVDFINGEEVYTINSHSTVSIPASESIKVTFGNAADVASATYAIMPMYPVESEEGTTWVPSMPNAEFGELSINTYGYAELAKTYEQGTKYQLDINVTYLDGTDYSESFQFDGATAGEEPTEPEIAVTYYEQGPVVDVIFTNEKDVVPSWNVDILLDGESVKSAEYGQEYNELYLYLNDKLTAGEHTIVFPVGSLVFDSKNDNTEEYTVTFTVEGPQESILGEPEIAIANDVLTITFDAPEGVEGASLASAGVVITKGETQYYGNADEAYAEDGKIVVTVPLANTMDMNTFSPYEPTVGDELTIAIKEPEVYANYADGNWEKVWAGDDIEASYTVAAEPINYKDLVNADFTDGKNGWTTTTTGGAWSNVEGATPKVVEAYAGWGSLEMTDFSISQKVVLPAGTYKLSAYAFYRYGVSYDVDPSKSCAKLYAGDKSVDVVTLGSIVANPYANSTAEASAAFAAGNYLNEVIFTVEEDGTEIEVGIAGAHELKQSWFICGPFSIEKYDPSTGIENIEIATKSNGKYIENGKVVIVRNGVKYNMNGVMIK